MSGLETIKVVYSEIGPGYYHKAIVYTDTEGNTYKTEGSPSIHLDIPALNVIQGEASILTNDSPFGRLQISIFGPYPPGPNNPTNGDDPSEIIAAGSDLSGYWENIKLSMHKINAAGLPYRPLNQNSNSAVDQALSDAGLPKPQFDRLENHFSPGSDQTLLKSGRAINANSSSFNYFEAAEAAPNKADPLILDLNGDGVKTTNYQDAILFDHDSNGFAELTNWVDANDGILAVDKDSNGTIDNGNEIFGNHTDLAGGGTATDGYAALADYDSNSDAKVDLNDLNFSQLRILKGDGTLITFIKDFYRAVA